LKLYNSKYINNAQTPKICSCIFEKIWSASIVSWIGW